MDQLVSAQHAEWPLFLQCVLSGLVDSITFATSQTWVAFMTGNLVQLVLALTECVLLQQPSSEPHHSAGDSAQESSASRLLLSSTALLGFCIGAFLCSRFVFRPKRGEAHNSRLTSRPTRRKYIIISLIHLLPFLVFPALQRGARDVTADSSLSVRMSSWLLLLLAMPFGSQSHASLSLGQHPYSTTVVFTSSLSSLCSDLSILPVSATRQTAKRASSIFALLLGASLGGTLMRMEQLHAQSLSSRSKGVQTVWAWHAVILLQLLVASGWYVIPGENEQEDAGHQWSSVCNTRSTPAEPYRDDPTPTSSNRA